MNEIAEKDFYIQEAERPNIRLTRPRRCPYCDGEAIVRFDAENTYIDCAHKNKLIECKGSHLTTWEIQELDLNRQIEIWNERTMKAKLALLNESRLHKKTF